MGTSGYAAFKTVYFNLFSAAVEPSAAVEKNVCVAHETLYNDSSVYPSFCNKPDG